MRDRKMISEISSKLAGSKLFQFVGLSHDIAEVEQSLDMLAKADVVVLENCFNADELHEFNRALNAKAASASKGKRIFKAIVYRHNEKVPNLDELSEMGFDIGLNIDESQQEMINTLSMKIFSDTCNMLDKCISQILADGVDIDGFNEELSAILHSVGIPASLLGYKYLKRAIEMAFINIDCVTSGVTKVVYPTIALMYKTTATKVERGMRHAIESGWQRADIEIMEKIFSYSYSSEKGKPTNGEFIANIADYLLVKYRAERKVYISQHLEQINRINALIDFSTYDLSDLIPNH